MKDPRFWIPLVVCLFLTLAFGLVAAASIGSGNHLGVMVLFPFAMLLTSLLDLQFGYLVAIALIQFPIYGLILGNGNLKGHIGRSAFALFLTHFVTVGLVMFVAKKGSF